MANNRINDIRALHQRHWSRKSLSELDDALGEVLAHLDSIMEVVKECEHDVVEHDLGKHYVTIDRAKFDTLTAAIREI